MKQNNIYDSWSEVDYALENKSTIKGVIEKRIHGGFKVNLDGVMAFLHVKDSQYKGNDYPPEINASYDFHVVLKERHGSFSRVVVSRKKMIKKMVDDRESYLLKTLKVGDTLSAKIKRINANYGLVIDIGGIAGGVHYKDIKNMNPLDRMFDIFKKNDVINVTVSKIDETSGKIHCITDALDKISS